MNKFHYNMKTGRVGRCTATVRPCPLGLSEAEHFPTSEEAQKAFENLNNSIPTSRKKVITPSLESIMDLDLLKRDIDEGFIAVRPHPEDDTLNILSYTSMAQIRGKWDDATKQARGLIVQTSDSQFSDAIIVERPWRKFFTLSQHTSGWALGDEENTTSATNSLDSLDFDSPAETTNKMDGSLGILYRSPNGSIALSTKGSFESDQAKFYTRLLHKNPELLEQAENLKNSEKDKTFLFELVGRDNLIVLNYDEDKIVLLGAVNKNTGLYYSPNDYSDRWSDGITETMPTTTVRDALNLPDRENAEGVVIRVVSNDPEKQMQLKVKQEDYLNLHRIMFNQPASSVREAIQSSSATYKDLLNAAKTGSYSELNKISLLTKAEIDHPSVHERVKERVRILDETLTPRLQKLSKAKEYVDRIPDEFFKQDNPAKTFALSIANNKELDKSDLFTFFNTRMKGQNIEGAPASQILVRLAKSIKVAPKIEDLN